MLRYIRYKDLTALIIIALITFSLSLSYARFNFGRLEAIKQRINKLEEKVRKTPLNPSIADKSTDQPTTGLTLSWSIIDKSQEDKVVYDVYLDTKNLPLHLFQVGRKRQVTLFQKH